MSIPTDTVSLRMLYEPIEHRRLLTRAAQSDESFQAVIVV
jgi:hypothetical protein